MIAKFGFERIFGECGTTSCSMYDGMYDGHVVYMSVTVWDGTGCEFDSLTVSDIYHMYIEPTITRVPSWFLDTYGLTQKLCSKNIYTQHIWVSMCIFFLLKSKVHVGAEVEGPPF